MLDFVEHVFAEAIGVGKCTLGLVNSPVDRTAEVFEKRAKEVAVERSRQAAGIQIKACRGVRRLREECLAAEKAG